MASRRLLDRRIRRRIDRAFQAMTGAVPAGARSLTPAQLIADRGYELVCLIKVMRELRASGGYHFTLAGGSSVSLRVKGGPIDRSRFAWIDVFDGSRKVAEIWNNIQVMGLSAKGQVATYAARIRHAHELDIVVLRGDSDRSLRTSGYPEPAEIAIAVEAKHRPYNKGLLKELLGVRRELSMLAGPWHPAEFGWPMPFVATPRVALVGFCSSPSITKYADPNMMFYAEMEYLPL